MVDLTLKYKEDTRTHTVQVVYRLLSAIYYKFTIKLSNLNWVLILKFIFKKQREEMHTHRIYDQSTIVRKFYIERK